MKKIKIWGLLLACCMTISSFSACGMISGFENIFNNTSSGSAVNLKYDIALYSCQGEGSITFDREKVEEGGSVTITATPTQGWKLTSLTINAEEKIKQVVDGKLIVDNITADIIVKAKFEEGGYATYVSETNKPVIDGEIDAVWETSCKFEAKNRYFDEADITLVYEEIGYTKVLWNETGLYFLGVVYDSDLVYGDVCNFWVSEVYNNEAHIANPETGKMMVTPYSIENGSYAMTVAADGNNYDYTGNDVTEYWTCEAKITDFGYVIEIFMPRMGTQPLSAGASMGFDVSIDYRSGEAKERDYYANWNGAMIEEGAFACPAEGVTSWNHSYWETPAALAEVILLPPNE